MPRGYALYIAIIIIHRMMYDSRFVTGALLPVSAIVRWRGRACARTVLSGGAEECPPLADWHWGSGRDMAWDGRCRNMTDDA